MKPGMQCVELPEGALELARSLAKEAQSYAAGRFGSALFRRMKGSFRDFVTEVDLWIEAYLLSEIRKTYPDHGIVTEESPDLPGNSPWTWVLDPLDGTNNYGFGLSMWGVAIALCYEGHPVLSCLADGATGTLITALTDDGVEVGGSAPVDHELVGVVNPISAFWTGYGTDRSSAGCATILQTLQTLSWRVFENWAPTVDARLYFTGGLDLIVGVGCRGTELPAVLHVLSEGGARIVGQDGAEVSLNDLPDVFVAGRPPYVEAFLARLPQRGLDRYV